MSWLYMPGLNRQAWWDTIRNQLDFHLPHVVHPALLCWLVLLLVGEILWTSQNFFSVNFNVGRGICVLTIAYVFFSKLLSIRWYFLPQESSLLPQSSLLGGIQVHFAIIMNASQHPLLSTCQSVSGQMTVPNVLSFKLQDAQQATWAISSKSLPWLGFIR